MQFETGKKYKTRNGSDVEVISSGVYTVECRTIIGILNEDGKKSVETWLPDGRYREGQRPHIYDLRDDSVTFVNLYTSDLDRYTQHKTVEAAKEVGAAHDTYLATLKVRLSDGKVELV